MLEQFVLWKSSFILHITNIKTSNPEYKSIRKKLYNIMFKKQQKMSWNFIKNWKKIRKKIKTSEIKQLFFT